MSCLERQERSRERERCAGGSRASSPHDVEVAGCIFRFFFPVVPEENFCVKLAVDGPS